MRYPDLLGQWRRRGFRPNFNPIGIIGGGGAGSSGVPVAVGVAAAPVAPAPVAGGGGAPAGGGGGGSFAAASTAPGQQRSQANVFNLLQWLFPSSDFADFEKGPQNTANGQPGDATPWGWGVVPLPALGATATLLTWTVPKGRDGKITALGIDFVAQGGAAFVQGSLPAQLTFALLADNTAFPDFGSFNYLPGSVTSPSPVAGLIIKEGQVISLTVTNNAIGGIVVTTQTLAARIQGYYWNKNRSPHLGTQ